MEMGCQALSHEVWLIPPQVQGQDQGCARPTPTPAWDTGTPPETGKDLSQQLTCALVHFHLPKKLQTGEQDAAATCSEALCGGQQRLSGPKHRDSAWGLFHYVTCPNPPRERLFHLKDQV